MRAVRRVLLATFLSAAGVLVAAPQQSATPAALTPLTQDVLFETTTIWTAHLSFSADAWKEIEPTQGPPTGRHRLTGGEWLHGHPGQRNGWAATRGIEFNYTRATLDFDGQVFRDVAVRYKGNGTFGPFSMQSMKNSFKVDLNKHVRGQKLADVSTLNFHNNINDPGFVNEVLAFRLFRDAGVPAPRTAWVRLYLTVDGLHDRRYLGVYSLVENVDRNFIDARTGSRDGPVFKPVTVTPFKDLGDDWADYVQSYDPKTDLTKADEQYIIDFCRLVTSGTDEEFAARVGDFIDLPAFARYMTVVAWFHNWDSILKNGQNYYVHVHPVTRKMHFIAWDQDSAWGVFSQQAPGSHAYGKIDPPWPEPVRFLDRMYALPEFRRAYLANMRELTDTLFRPERFPPQLQEMSAILRPLLSDEPSKARADRDTTDEQLALFDSVINGEIRFMPFVNARAQFVREQLAAITD